VKRVDLPALDHGSMAPVPVLYAIRIYGHLGALVLSAFGALGLDLLEGPPARTATQITEIR